MAAIPYKCPQSMLSVAADGSVTYVEPQHATRVLRGIEIDTNICDLIEFLWDHDLKTMRSCEDLNGFVYIAFPSVCDAVNAGLLTATLFCVHLATNSEYGGYVGTGLFIPQGLYNILELPFKTKSCVAL